MSGRTRTRSLRAAPLRVGATFDAAVRQQLEQRSRAQKLVAGAMVAGAAVALAHLTGTDVRAGLGGGQPHLTDYAVRGLSSPAASLGE